MSPGLQPFLLPTWLFSSIWFKVLSTVSFCLLQMLPSWRLILPATCAFDLVMKVPLGFPPPCLVSLYLPTQKQIQTPFLPSAGLASLQWTAKSKQKVGGLQGGSKVITSMWMIHSPKKFLVCRQGKMEKCPWGAIFFPIMKLHGGRCQMWSQFGRFCFNWVLFLFWVFSDTLGYSPKNLQGIPLMDATQAWMIFFFHAHLTPHRHLPTEGQEGSLCLGRLSSLQMIDNLKLTLHWEGKSDNIAADLKSSSAWGSLPGGLVRAKVLHEMHEATTI